MGDKRQEASDDWQREKQEARKRSDVIDAS
jgi:hypothetical protein